MNKSLARKFGLPVAALVTISLAGCAPQEPSPEVEAKPTIVTTTNVWASVAQQVAGDNFEVVALISDPAIDPHSYEASARDQLAVSESSLFIVNGGGYDEFALTLATAADVVPLNVYEEHGAEHAEDQGHEGDAEGEHADEHGHDGSDHIWYDFEVAGHTAELIAAKLSELQPENADTFSENAELFLAELAIVEQRRDSLVNDSISYFEAHPLAALLLKSLSFQNLTPEGFAEAEEAELEPSVAIIAESEALIASGTLSFIAVNQQVTSQTLESLKELASAQGVPVLEFNELLPPGVSYQDWADSVLDQIAALG